jgi:hypothetical protein
VEADAPGVKKDDVNVELGGRARNSQPRKVEIKAG